MLNDAMRVAAAIAEQAGPRTSLSVWVRPRSANLAAMLAFVRRAPSVTMFRQRRRLTYAAAAALLALPVTLMVSETLRIIELSRAYRLWVAEVLLSWAFALAVPHKLLARTVAVPGRGTRADRLTGVADRPWGWGARIGRSA